MRYGIRVEIYYTMRWRLVVYAHQIEVVKKPIDNITSTVGIRAPYIYTTSYKYATMCNVCV